MSPSTIGERNRLRQLDRTALAQHQVMRLNRLLTEILPTNPFYESKLSGRRLPLSSLEHLRDWPFTYKEELLDSGSEYAANHTNLSSSHARFHQTSGTRGRPIIMLDTAADWQWFVDTWQYVLDAAEVTAADLALMAFSFGPFIGFWSANEALVQRGCLVVPTGGMSTLARLELLRVSRATVICCTPSYALHMLEVAGEHKMDVASLDVAKIIVAGEPGGSIPAIRQRIETGWQARLIDHAGATEIGPWGYGNREGTGLYITESEFIAEFYSISTGKPASEGELSELVLTGLGRTGCPLIRYRTGDLVRPQWSHAEQPDAECRFVFLEGGLLGRTDDMMIIRGVNIFPSSIEQIVRSFPEVVEYRLTVHRVAAMDQLSLEVEDRLENTARIEDELQLRLGLRVAVTLVPIGSLPRFDGKGKRFIDRR
ncbi:MAG: phenylacetate--CoA ligase family protein [Planctomycetota bacterium]|nr:phenylacetate--CoA ligase family protein [Planctomycetota bacterium]